MNKSKKHNCDVISTTSDHERIITALKSEIERLKTLLDAAQACIYECDYAMSKVTVDRVNDAIRDWEKAVETYGYWHGNEWDAILEGK